MPQHCNCAARDVFRYSAALDSLMCCLIIWRSSLSSAWVNCCLTQQTQPTRYSGRPPVVGHEQNQTLLKKSILLNSLCSECVSITNLSYHLFIYLFVSPVPFFWKLFPYKVTYVLLLIPLYSASAFCILFVFLIWLCLILFKLLTNIIHRCSRNNRPRISNDSSTIFSRISVSKCKQELLF